MSDDQETFYLLSSKSTLATDAPEEWLGRVVEDYQLPRAGYAPESTATFRGKVESDDGQTSVSEYLRSKSGKSIYAALCNVLTASSSDSHSSSPSIKADKVEMLTIGQHSQVWNDLKASKADLAKVKGNLAWTGNKAYLIVGLLVTQEITYTENKASESGLSIHAKVPVKEITTGAIGVPIDAPVETKIDQSTEKSREGGAVLVNRRIFAIQYRVLRKHRIIKSGSIEVAKDYLKGNRMFGGVHELGEEDDTASAETMLDEDILLEDEFDDAHLLFSA